MEITKEQVQDALAAVLEKSIDDQPEAVKKYLTFAGKRDAIKLGTARFLSAQDEEVQDLTAELNRAATLADVVMAVVAKAEQYLPMLMAAL